MNATSQSTASSRLTDRANIRTSGIPVRIPVAALLILLLGFLSHRAFDDAIHARAATIACAAIILWLLEAIPLYATTLLLWASIALFLGPIKPGAFSLDKALAWSAHPILALFLGGFALSAAATRHGIDRAVASAILRISRGRQLLLLFAVMAGAATLSMWMSNIAAAAMLLATLRPLLADPAVTPSFRRALLLGIAFAANFGGIATPIGTGPNLIAIAAVSPMRSVTFIQWMLMGVPLTVLLLTMSYLLIVWLHHVRGPLHMQGLTTNPLTVGGKAVVCIFFIAVAAWLTEPLHGVPAALTALLVAAALFGSGLLDLADLRKLEWDTLLLVAGGLALGELLHHSTLARTLATSVDWHALPPFVMLLAFIAACAALSAVASNTAAAVILINIGLQIIPSPSFAILVALGASMGVPFAISTPPNAMVYGLGHLRPRDLLIPGLILMTFGCILLATTGPWLLRFHDIP